MKTCLRRSIVSLMLGAALFAAMLQPFTAADQPPRRDTAAASSNSSTAASKGKTFTTSQKYKYAKIKARIPKYQEYNKDVKGWLTVPGTNIDDPIISYAGNNKQYLYRTWRGVDYPNTTYANFVDTAVYADYRVRWGDNSWKQGSRNIVLYGHNWTNLRAPFAIGTENSHRMFGQLPSYTNIDFLKQNPYIYFSTDDYEGIWKVFCVSYAELKLSFPYNSPNPSAADFDTLLKEWKARSMFKTDVDVTSTDTLLTLSTCTRYYDNIGDKQRYVVVARLLRPGESENDPIKVAVNKDQKTPQF